MNYSKAFSLYAVTAVAAIGLLAAATPAFSKGAPVFVTAPVDMLSRHVSYADLNLASVAGESALERRVGTAVTGLCLDATGGNDGGTKFKLSMMRCDREAWNGARPQIDRAVRRAQGIAATGASSIAAAAITISLPK
jgi:UrcA family protein